MIEHYRARMSLVVYVRSCVLGVCALRTWTMKKYVNTQRFQSLKEQFFFVPKVGKLKENAGVTMSIGLNILNCCGWIA